MIVLADPQTAVVDALRARLLADPVLVSTGAAGMRAASAITGHVSAATRVAYPYVLLGRRADTHEGGAMQVDGARPIVQIDVWSNAAGPYEAAALASRLFTLLERAPLVVTGFDVLDGSLHCEWSEVFDEPDPDNAEARLYHSVQRWTVELHGRP